MLDNCYQMIKHQSVLMQCLEVKLMYFESVSKILGKNTTEKDDVVFF